MSVGKPGSVGACFLTSTARCLLLTQVILHSQVERIIYILLSVKKLVVFSLENIDNFGFKFYYFDLLVLSKSAYYDILPLSWMINLHKLH